MGEENVPAPTVDLLTGTRWQIVDTDAKHAGERGEPAARTQRRGVPRARAAQLGAQHSSGRSRRARKRLRHRLPCPSAGGWEKLVTRSPHPGTGLGMGLGGGSRGRNSGSGRLGGGAGPGGARDAESLLLVDLELHRLRGRRANGGKNFPAGTSYPRQEKLQRRRQGETRNIPVTLNTHTPQTPLQERRMACRYKCIVPPPRIFTARAALRARSGRLGMTAARRTPRPPEGTRTRFAGSLQAFSF
ncbi:uncharacterized protein LOC123652798 [Pipistrellus kuhlii]|uniref:uncharacterized protein LOC123652798 n=1 Tax=Pipistrellus kuhlii TaxID=59472 RepID=UPI001E27492B|nr:uncharacterized protein LOC123652798 [Pipistrellus kuhlii]